MNAKDKTPDQDIQKEKFNLEEFLEKYKWSIGFGLIGLTILSLGFYHFFFSPNEQTSVEIIRTDEESSENLWVDVEGAIEKPGLYELPSGSRVNDLLIKSGGLSAEADRSWVEKNLNLAQKLTDGIKVYIPPQGEVVILQNSGSVAGSSAIGAKININTASLAELDRLWGIGQARAESIIAARPYQSVEELKTKKIIPANVYERIKDEISVY